MECRNPFCYEMSVVKGTAAWLSPAVLYSPLVPAGTEGSEITLGGGKVTTFAWHLSVKRLLVSICNAIGL